MFIAFLAFSMPYWLTLLTALLTPFLFGLTTGMGNTFAAGLLDRLYGAVTFTPPATWYGALFTTDPTNDDGTGLVEVSGGSYARVSVTNNNTNFPNSSTVSNVTTKTTGTAIDWGTASANWGTIVGAAFFDASTSGNLGMWGPLASNKTVNSGDGFKINSGNCTLTLG